MVGTLETLQVPLLATAQGRAPMQTPVHEYLKLIVCIAGENDGDLANECRFIVANILDLTRVPDENPRRVEDALHFLLENRGVSINGHMNTIDARQVVKIEQ
jgi:hypothetical protein